MSIPRILPKFALCLLFLLVFWTSTLLAGCQPSPAPTQPSSSATPNQETIEAVKRTSTAASTGNASIQPTRTPSATSSLGILPGDLQGLQLQFWHALNGKGSVVIDELVQDFNSSNPWGIVVGASSLENYDDLSAQTAGAIEQGTPPDIVAAYEYQSARWGERSSAVLANLSPYIQDPEYGLDSTEQADFYPVFWEAGSSSQEQLSFPALRNGQVLFYNQSWAEELGYTSPPSNLEQFKDQACAAAMMKQSDDDPDNDLTGGWIASADYPTVLGWLYAFDSPVVKPGGGYQLGTSQTENAFRYLRQLYEQHCAWFAEDINAEEEFAQRSGLFAAGSLSDIPYLQEALAKAGNRDRWTVIPFPSASGEPAITTYGPSYHVLQSTPERQLAAWLFVRWMASPVNQARLAEATYSLPLRRSALDYILNFRTKTATQWRAGLDLLPDAHAEPEDPSWYTVRWAISDAATQLYRWYFTMKQLPEMVQLLDQTASEFYQKSH